MYPTSMGRSAVDSSIRGWHLRSRHEAEEAKAGVTTSCSDGLRRLGWGSLAFGEQAGGGLPVRAGHVQPEGDGDRDRQRDRRRTANAITCLVSSTGSMESGVRSWAGALQVNRQAWLCDEFGGAQSSK